jgi:hypothetical protein
VADEIRVTRGVPTDEELAAIVGVLFLRSVARTQAQPPTNLWAASARPGYAHRDGRPVRPGAASWRSSSLPL